jgi:predicted dehydrogenase
MKKIKLTVVGTGQFAQGFIPLFRVHPGVGEVSLCEVLPERLATESKRHGISRCFSDFQEVLKSDVDAVAIFTQRWMHAPMALAALNAGKHVYCAVPAATTVEELQSLIQAVKQTGLIYMMGETSLYYGSRLFMKEKWDAGEFGHFVYGEGEYLHDMSHGFYQAFQFSGGNDWKQTASFPPMLYPTHSVAMVLSVTGANATHVSCMGFEDRSDDGVFDASVSLWKNAFSNQSALFRTSDGGMMRINEFRRVGQRGGRSVRGSLYGTEGSFEEQSNGAIWTTRTISAPLDVEEVVRCAKEPNPKSIHHTKVDAALKGDFISTFGEIHQKYRDRLPEEFREEVNGHEGSHQLLADDFVTAVLQGSRPTCDVFDAARYNLPGIIAHKSAQQGGELMKIPDL